MVVKLIGYLLVLAVLAAFWCLMVPLRPWISSPDPEAYP